MSFAAILKIELRETLRQPLTWAVLGLLVATMLVGSMVGGARVARQRATIDRVGREAAHAVATAKAASVRYGHAAPITVAQFRDPTDAFGYKNSFLASYATLAPAPLAALAAGQSDLQPSFLRVQFASVFPDAAYELKSPRILALGAFDLGFVLVYLVPLAIIALGGTRLSGEQDSGILRMIAAQPVTPAAVAAAKFLALALIAAPVIALASPLSLWIGGGVDPRGAAVALIVLTTLVALYVAFWITACALVASFWRGAVAALGTLVLGWAAMTVLLPSIAALVLDAALPAPSRIAYVDASRAAADRVAADPRAAAVWLAGRPDLVRINAAAGASPEVARLAREALNRAALLPERRAIDRHATRVGRYSDRLRLLSPALLLDGALQSLAGTDIWRQRSFVDAADRYTEKLRRWFDPRIIATVGAPVRCVGCPGRMTFDAYDAVPAFRPAPVAPDLGPARLAALYLLGATVLMAAVARRRYRTWPL